MPLILNLGTRQRRMTSFTPMAAGLPGIISTTTQCVEGRVDSSDSLDTLKKRKIYLCCWEPDHNSFVVHPTPYDTNDTTVLVPSLYMLFQCGSNYNCKAVLDCFTCNIHQILTCWWYQLGETLFQDPPTLTSFLFISLNLVLIITLLPLTHMKDLCNKNQQNALFTFNLFW